MGLNEYRDEVASFLEQVTTEPEPVPQIMKMLNEEIVLLEASLDDPERMSHQLDDVLFLLLEVAAIYNIDMDAEWIRGRERKRIKYLEG